mgnify:CR=1 FL=1
MKKKKVYQVSRYLFIHCFKHQGQTIFSKQVKSTRSVEYGKTVYVVAENEENAKEKYRSRYSEIFELNDTRKLYVELRLMDYGEKLDKDDLSCKETIVVKAADDESYCFLQHNLAFNDFMELVRQELFPTGES